MQTTILEQEPILLAGMSYFGNPFVQPEEGGEVPIHRLWARVVAFLELNPDALPPLVAPGVVYEVHVPHTKERESGRHEAFVGVEVATVRGLPVLLQAKMLPARLYLRVLLQGREIVSDWFDPIVQDWLPKARHRLADSFSYQRYDHRFKGGDRLAESEMEVYVPVEPVR
ncbi:MAG: GyrI-like domain-containing protein [Anaerolineae bacterium]|nr:GyrI-like domain-containing protein [Anaerolineae bacterium]